jgi:hypothetical protein
VRASLGACSWLLSGGGQLFSSGNLHNVDGVPRTWSIAMVWLQNGRELARQTGAVSLAPGEIKAWQLAKPQAAPPADLACALEVGS